MMDAAAVKWQYIYKVRQESNETGAIYFFLFNIYL